MSGWGNGWGDNRGLEDREFAEHLARDEEADRRAAILEERWEAQREAAGLEPR